MIKAILFDFFDVFRADSYKAWLVAEGLSEDPVYHEMARLQDSGEITNAEFFVRLSQLQGRPITKDELEKAVWVDQEVIQLAERLHDHYRTALISNAPTQFIRGLLDELDLARLFDEIVVSSEVNLVKPEPAIFELTLQRVGVKSNEAVFIDDNPRNAEGAEAVGIRGIVHVSARQLEADLKALGVQA